MKFTRELPAPGTFLIRGYEAGRIRVNERIITRSVIVRASELVLDCLPEDFAALEQAHFDRLLSFEPEIILLGTGATLRFPPRELTAYVLARGVGFEVMDTPAACRTYNILVAENRRVVAALMMI
ncbi:MAG TPA: Mth938-like domain-containing protein [Gammaproteobacteria bacterium]|nr:Mth938-like domain-containing protein [Gammaproteobacteria bacterium]